MKKSFAARTAKIQKELDDAAADKDRQPTEAAGIRQAKGDIAAERARIWPRPTTQAERVLDRRSGSPGHRGRRARGQGRQPTSPPPAAASATSCVPRSPGCRSAAVDHVVSGSLDDATQQELIENFIARVGASA